MSYGAPPPANGSPPAYGGSAVPPAKKPGKVLFVLTGVFALLMIGCFVVGGVSLAKNTLGKIDDFKRVSVSEGTKSVHLSSGNYIVYFELPTSRNSGNVHFLIDPVSPGAAPKLRDYGSNTHTTYTTDGRHGIAKYTLKINKSGSYRVSVTGSPSQAGIAIGTSIAKGLAFGGVLIALGVLFLFVAIILLIIAIVRRVRFGRRARAYAGPAGYGGPPPPGYGGPPPPGYGGPPPGYGQQPGTNVPPGWTGNQGS